MSTLMAALRDCTFYASPAGFGKNPRPPKYHAIVERPGEDSYGRGPACGYPFHDEETEEPAQGVMDSERCGRPGCKKAFATLTAKPGAEGV